MSGEVYPKFASVKGLALTGFSGKSWIVSGNEPLGFGVEAIVCLGKPVVSESTQTELPEVALKIVSFNFKFQKIALMT